MRATTIGQNALVNFTELFYEMFEDNDVDICNIKETETDHGIKFEYRNFVVVCEASKNFCKISFDDDMYERVFNAYNATSEVKAILNKIENYIF